MKRPSAAFVLLFFGIVLVTAGAILSVGAIRFEFAYAGPAPEPGVRVAQVLDYEELTAGGKGLVRRAIDGERFVFKSEVGWPGTGDGDLGVYYRGTLHLFTRDVYFATTSNFGIAAIVAFLTGIGCTVAGIRRDVRGRPLSTR